MLQENDAVKQWADEGKAKSLLRPGRVSTLDGKPEDYRSVMAKVYKIQQNRREEFRK
jgi:hypothetical protein